MDISKKRGFVDAGKRLRMKKGGVVPSLPKRQRFVDGGTVHALSSAPPATTWNSATNPSSGLMGTVNDFLGLNDKFQAGAAQITPGTNIGQLNDSYTTATGALQGQMDLANSLNPQVAQATQNQSQLADQYAAMARGEGPNPALEQLHKATGQNIAGQAALAAGQRGANQNVGLLAREIANQGARTQQDEVGQASVLQAQQQIAAQNNLANLSGSQIGQTQGAVTGANTAAQNEQNILQGANTAANNAAVGMQSNINNTNAQTSMANQAQAGKTMSSIASAIPVIGGMFAKGGAVEPHLQLAEMNSASLKHHYAGGGPISENPLTAAQPQHHENQIASYFAPVSQPGGPAVEATPDMSSTMVKNTMDTDIKSLADKYKKEDPKTTTGTAGDWELGGQLSGGEGLAGAPMLAARGGMAHPNYCKGQHKSHVANYLAEGGEVPAMVSPGEIYLSPDQVQRVVREGHDPAKVGQKIGGKAKTKGDSYSNDTVPMTLQEGGVVIDRKNVGTREKRELFVHRALARKKAERK